MSVFSAIILGIICFPFVIIAFFFLFIFEIFLFFYYRSQKFLSLKARLEGNTEKCNELNRHIESLKTTYIKYKKIDYGTARQVDTSVWKYKKPEMKKYKNSPNIVNCSKVVCHNAELQPFKYLCKYFNIPINEDSLEEFEDVLNNFSAAEQGKILLKNEREKIINDISSEIPFFIRKFSNTRLMKELGFDEVDFSDLYFPEFKFLYISPGGNVSNVTPIKMDIVNLDKFIIYLSGLVKYKKSIQGQRALMTTKLREQIKKRDNYTCQCCGNSTYKEPNLLLEIDHIVPLSKNGFTTENNLQTLCWRCNREKGSKIGEKYNNITVNKDQFRNSSEKIMVEEKNVNNRKIDYINKLSIDELYVIRKLIIQNKTIEAIIFIRDVLKIEVPEAKLYVEEMSENMGVRKKINYSKENNDYLDDAYEDEQIKEGECKRGSLENMVEFGDEECEELDDVISLIRQNKKIEAIKQYRMITGCGLIEAKKWVDGYKTNNTYDVRDVDIDDFDDILYLISQNKKVDAIKKYRKKTGCGLVEAKEWVDNHC